jgi:hypothetical protein
MMYHVYTMFQKKLKSQRLFIYLFIKKKLLKEIKASFGLF